MKRRTASALILILTALFLTAGLSSCNDPESTPPLTDEEALRGQWAVYLYYSEESDTGTETETADPETQQTEMFSGFIIDIQYTKTGYWFFGRAKEEIENPEDITAFYDAENPEAEIVAGDDMNLGYFIKSDRTQEEDGWFIISVPEDVSDNTDMKIRYRFTDEERNTMEAEITNSEAIPESENPEAGKNIPGLIMRRLNHVIEILPLPEAGNQGGEEATSPSI